MDKSARYVEGFGEAGFVRYCVRLPRRHPPWGTTVHHVDDIVSADDTLKTGRSERR